jgi:hypothetical protein
MGLPDMFSGVNENFAIAAIEGALTMVRDSVDLAVVGGAASKSGVDILPTKHNVQRAPRAVSKRWWRCFSYDYVLAAIHTNHDEVLAYL